MDCSAAGDRRLGDGGPVDPAAAVHRADDGARRRGSRAGRRSARHVRAAAGSRRPRRTGRRPRSASSSGCRTATCLPTRTALRNALLITFPLLLGASGRDRLAGDRLDAAAGGAAARRRGADQQNGAGQRPAARERLPVPAAADEIRALAITLNDMLDRLAEAQERQRPFVADAAHELRSPLASMQAQLEVAQRLGEGGTLPADLWSMSSGCQRLVEDSVAARAAPTPTPGRRPS